MVIHRGDASGEWTPPVDGEKDTEGSGDTPTEDWGEQVAAKDASESNLIALISEVESIAKATNLASTEEVRAAELATEAWENSFTHGRSMEITAAAAIYVTTRQGSEAVPPGVLADAAGCSPSKLKKAFINMKRDLRLDVRPPVPQNYLGYLRQSLDLGIESQQSAEELLSETETAGGNPVGVAAAALYEGVQDCRDEITLRELAEEIFLTKETVWRHTQRFDEEVL